ncbi:MAG: hypothetical protein WC756_10470 [Taibaiella sp.]|jgi:hypothetical protein
MNAYQQTINPGLFFQHTPAISKIGTDLKDRFTPILDNLSISRGWRNSLLNQIEEISDECQNKDWDGDDALPVKQYAKFVARKFVLCLPENITPPEVTITPEGYFAFDWMKKKNHILSVEVLENILIYACILGDKKEYGEFLFYNEISKPLSTLLKEYF